MRHLAKPNQTGRLVRPYALTGGRTGAEFSEIALEAHVLATPLGRRAADEFRWEAAEVIDRAQQPTAVVELAALIDVPIGVIRVLAGDLQERGAVTISNPASEVVEAGGDEYADLLQKVLDGIKSL